MDNPESADSRGPGDDEMWVTTAICSDSGVVSGIVDKTMWSGGNKPKSEMEEYEFRDAVALWDSRMLGTIFQRR